MFAIPKYDVFISYSNEDRAWAQLVHHSLTRRGFVSSFDDCDSLNENFRDKIFEALYDSAVCVLIIGSRKHSPWCDDDIGEAIDERVSNSHGEYRVVRTHYPDVIDDPEKLRELIRLIRGADRQPSLLANPKTREWARMRAKNALDVDWDKLCSDQQSQSEYQSTQRRTRFHERAQEYRKMLLAFATRLTGEHGLAEEIAQETMVNYLTLREADHWQQDLKNEAAYLFKMARNFVRNEWRAQCKFKSVSLDQPLDHQLRKDLSTLTVSLDVEKQIYLEELCQTLPLKAILGGLSGREMQLLYLSRIQELSYEQIARKVNENPVVVRYELQRILARVQARAKKILGKKSLFKSGS